MDGRCTILGISARSGRCKGYTDYNLNIMTDKEIVMAAKTAEKKTEFCELVHSKVSRGIHSAFGIGFIEGAVWMMEQYEKK